MKPSRLPRARYYLVAQSDALGLAVRSPSQISGKPRELCSCKGNGTQRMYLTPAPNKANKAITPTQSRKTETTGRARDESPPPSAYRPYPSLRIKGRMSQRTLPPNLSSFTPYSPQCQTRRLSSTVDSLWRSPADRVNVRRHTANSITEVREPQTTSLAMVRTPPTPTDLPLVLP
ncbi:hypothetical protein PR048_005644 [Dryococelus australis]|uniref:Uncharacterized protein n=1 Tax=Dryococelus australis TaxID=614101 RepID=A0ABQ9IAW7_9NEOP|nr:hypothetical protein PR048_005644 [Dryococelus australis]